jgi:esterase
VVSLAHEIVEGPAADRSAFLVHGLLGSRRNWLSFARRLVQAHPRWRVVLVDLRNHGDSHGMPPPHDLPACARDLGELAAQLGEEPRLVVGHSFGGKVALGYAAWQASELEEVWVLDAPPGGRLAAGAGSVEQVFKALGELPLPIAGRKELIAELTGRGLPPAIAQWMTTNLQPAPSGGFTWRFNLAACTEMLHAYGAAELWAAVEAPPSGVRVCMVRGGTSDRWRPDDVQRLEALARAGTIAHHVLPEAGHWLHTEDPDGLFALLAPSLQREGLG